MGCMSSKPTQTTGIDPVMKLSFPTQISCRAKSITRLDKYTNHRALKQFLETKFGPQVVQEDGRDVLLWLVEVSSC